MQNHTYGRALAAYQKVGMEGSIAGAGPHKLIALLIDGALERIAKGKGYLTRGETARKGECIGRAIAIVEGLRVSLNKEVGGELAENLDTLYGYMTRRLLQANVRNDSALLDEVSGLLNEIKSAWEALPEKLDVSCAHVASAGAMS